MQGIRFEFDWIDPERIKGPELSATWASLIIKADDSVITRVLDTRAKTVRDFVYVPLYPLAEWLVANWWFITKETQNPEKEGTFDFRQRHSLGSSRDGYAFPDLEIVPYGAQTRIGWKKALSSWTKVEFLDYGYILDDSERFRETCADLIDQVIRRLTSLGVEETFLQEEWNAIQAADDEEVSFCEVAAGLGWDPYALDDHHQALVIQLGERLGKLLDEAIPALDAIDPITGSSAIMSTIGKAKLNSLPLQRIEKYRAKSQYQCGGINPWDTGYAWARRLRHDLGLNGEPLRDMELFADALGEDVESLNRVTRPVESLSSAPLIDGVVTTDDETLGFAFRPLNDNSMRFHFCRGLAEVFATPRSDALITKARTGRQQRNRAFAAEFLAPSSGLSQTVSGVVIDGDEVDDLAMKFGVSSYVIRHQIENHRIARVTEPMYY